MSICFRELNLLLLQSRKVDKARVKFGLEESKYVVFELDPEG